MELEAELMAEENQTMMADLRDTGEDALTFFFFFFLKKKRITGKPFVSGHLQRRDANGR
jgi:hypothetical protein